MNPFRKNLYFTSKYVSGLRKYSKPSDFVRVIEVGPRDGLQNETKIVPTDIKVKFIDMLSSCGFPAVEATSFVSPKWVPQMSDNTEVMKKITRHPDVSYPVLVPNTKGLESAIAAGAKEIAIFGSASEAFSMKNVNCSVSESIQRFRDVVFTAKGQGLKVRGYVSCVVGCPYEGPVKPSQVAKATSAMFEMGCYEVSLGDTIGVGTAGSIRQMLEEVFHVSTANYLALHCHDTYGQALANVIVGLDMGVRTFDSSVSGLGGCPYAKGASGNLATEDLLYMLNGAGANTGIDLMKVVHAGRFICNYLGIDNMSKVNKAVGDKFGTHEELRRISQCQF